MVTGSPPPDERERLLAVRQLIDYSTKEAEIAYDIYLEDPELDGLERVGIEQAEWIAGFAFRLREVVNQAGPPATPRDARAAFNDLSAREVSELAQRYTASLIADAASDPMIGWTTQPSPLFATVADAEQTDRPGTRRIDRGEHLIDVLPNRAIGFIVGLLILLFVWYPMTVVAWFVASLIPGAIALRLGSVPAGYSTAKRRLLGGGSMGRDVLDPGPGCRVTPPRPAYLSPKQRAP